MDEQGKSIITVTRCLITCDVLYYVANVNTVDGRGKSIITVTRCLITCDVLYYVANVNTVDGRGKSIVTGSWCMCSFIRFPLSFSKCERLRCIR